MMKRKQLISEILLLLVILGAILFVIRFWPAVILVLAAIFIAVIVSFCLAVRQRHSKAASIPAQNENDAQCSKAMMEYGSITMQISKLVQSEHPKAKWVWAQPDTQKRLTAGEDVFILLSGAGGYARAKVVIEDGLATALEYKERGKTALSDDRKACAEQEALEADYDLFAFEWLEAHIQTLDVQCNDALGQGEHELFLPAETLPVKAAWVCICRELNKSKQFHAECVSDGIKIELA